jgi:hypothetical protein
VALSHGGFLFFKVEFYCLLQIFENPMFIHRALNSIPSKPVLFLAPILISVVLGTYYFNVKTDCELDGTLREKFVADVVNAGETGVPLRLDELNPANWEFAKTFQNFQPKHRKRSCPLGWDWSDQTRQELIDAGMLSVIIFFNEGVISRILEFNNSSISVEEIDGRLTRDLAVFNVDKSANDGQVHYFLSDVSKQDQ